jgi:hypothetical protein
VASRAVRVYGTKICASLVANHANAIAFDFPVDVVDVLDSFDEALGNMGDNLKNVQVTS